MTITHKGTVRMAAADNKDREYLWSLYRAASRCDNRWGGMTTSMLADELAQTELDRAHKLLLLRAFQVLIDEQSSFMRILHGFEILFDNFCDRDSDVLELHPDVMRQLSDGELLPVVMDAYREALVHIDAQAARIAELESRYAEVSGWYAKMKTRMLAAEKEQAALSAKVKPAESYSDDGDLTFTIDLYDDSDSNLQVAMWLKELRRRREQPAAPVAVPDDDTLREMIRVWNRAAEPLAEGAYQAMREALLLNSGSKPE